MASDGFSTDRDTDKKYRGVRQRRWGKWVSEIRVPGSRERLWLGSYSSPEAAAVAHDTAVFFLRGPEPPKGLNFPERVNAFSWACLSPTSIQTAASNAGMAVDARLATGVDVAAQTRPQSSTGIDRRSWRVGESSFCGASELSDDIIFFDDVDMLMLD